MFLASDSSIRALVNIYVATIFTETHSLTVTCNDKIVNLFEYRLPPEMSIDTVTKELASYLKDLGILDLL